MKHYIYIIILVLVSKTLFGQSNLETDTCFVFVENDTELLIELAFYKPNDTTNKVIDFVFEPNEKETRLAIDYNDYFMLNPDYYIRFKNYNTSEIGNLVLLKEVSNNNGRIIKIVISDLFNNIKK